MEIYTFPVVVLLSSISGVFLINSEQNNQDFYHVLEESKAILNAEPFHQENATSEIECLLKARRHEKKACFVQMESELTSTGSRRLCQLFEASDSIETISKEHSKIYKSLTGCSKPKPRDCLEWYDQGFKKDGVYEIEINNTVTKVQCLMSASQPGWTVFQRRFDGSENFDRSWQEYKDGFGNVEGEYWLGNEMIHLLTQVKTKIRIEGGSYEGKSTFITAKNFWIENEANHFKLHAGNKIYGYDSFYNDWKAHDGMLFSAAGAHNSSVDDTCSWQHGSGWWFKPLEHDCQDINLNGPYLPQGFLLSEGRGVVWKSFIGGLKSLKSTVIAIKRIV